MMKRALAAGVLAIPLLLVGGTPLTSQPPAATPAPAAAEAARGFGTQLNAPVMKPEHSLVLIEARTNARYVRVRVRKVNDWFRQIDVRELRLVEGDTTRRWVWTGPPGQYAVEVTCFDPELGIEDHLVEVVIGNDPGPQPPDPPEPPGPRPPGPEPDEVPEDPFDNIGRRVASWKPEGQQTAALALAAVYKQVAQGLAEGSILDIDDASQKLAELKAGLSLSGWELWNRQVREDTSERTEMSRQEWIAYLEAIATGLEYSP